MVDLDAALFHHLLKPPITDRVGDIPAHPHKMTSRSKWLPLNSIIVTFRPPCSQPSYCRPTQRIKFATEPFLRIEKSVAYVFDPSPIGVVTPRRFTPPANA